MIYYKIDCGRIRLFREGTGTIGTIGRCGAISTQIQGNDVYISYSDGKAELWRIGVGYLKTC